MGPLAPEADTQGPLLGVNDTRTLQASGSPDPSTSPTEDEQRRFAIKGHLLPAAKLQTRGKGGSSGDARLPN